MLKITREIDLNDFEAWGGGKQTLDKLRELGFVEQVECAIEECYPHGLDETLLNDILWFEDEFINDIVGFDIWEVE